MQEEIRSYGDEDGNIGIPKENAEQEGKACILHQPFDERPNTLKPLRLFPMRLDNDFSNLRLWLFRSGIGQVRTDVPNRLLQDAE
jgi:hypothetical protein